jgi:hypothetical protein
MADQLTTVAKERLTSKLGVLSRAEKRGQSQILEFISTRHSPNGDSLL